MIRSPGDMKSFYEAMTYARLKTTREFFQSRVTRPLTETDKQWLVDESMKTPTSVAVLLDYDGNMADFTEEARMIDGKIPVMNVLADPGWNEGWTAAGKAWLKKNAPNSEVIVFGLHLIHWEFPDRFQCGRRGPSSKKSNSNLRENHYSCLSVASSPTSDKHSADLEGQ
jgi:hypothetical protein